MKKSLLIVITFAIIALFCSCDDGLLIVDFEISKLPDKLIYLQNIDNSIDLTGGEVLLKLQAGTESLHSMTDHYITKIDDSSVDFSKEGLYYVEIYIHNDKSQRFPIIVASKERLQELLNNS